MWGAPQTAPESKIEGAQRAVRSRRGRRGFHVRWLDRGRSPPPSAGRLLRSHPFETLGHSSTRVDCSSIASTAIARRVEFLAHPPGVLPPPTAVREATVSAPPQTSETQPIVSAIHRNTRPATRACSPQPRRPRPRSPSKRSGAIEVGGDGDVGSTPNSPRVQDRGSSNDQDDRSRGRRGSGEHPRASSPRSRELGQSSASCSRRLGSELGEQCRPGDRDRYLFFWKNEANFRSTPGLDIKPQPGQGSYV